MVSFKTQSAKFSGAFRPSRQFLSGSPRIPAIGFKVTVYDYASPAFDATAEFTRASVRAMINREKALLEAHIKEKFRTGPARWPVLQESTVRWKAKHGIPWPSWTLRETLTLQTNVDRIHLRAISNKDSHAITLPPDNFYTSPYVAFHELGIGQKKRSFLTDAIEDAYASVGYGLSIVFGEDVDALRHPRERGIQPRIYGAGVGLGTFGGGLGLISLLIPPSSAYALVGAGFDIEGLLTGQFTSGAASAWVRNWALGQYGLTAKVQRRRLRRGIWRT